MNIERLTAPFVSHSQPLIIAQAVARARVPPVGEWPCRPVSQRCYVGQLKVLAMSRMNRQPCVVAEAGFEPAIFQLMRLVRYQASLLCSVRPA